MRRGEVVLVDFGHPAGHEAGFVRPALVLTGERFNRSGLFAAVPITRTRRGYPTHVEIESPLRQVSHVQCEHLRTISADRVIRSLGQAEPAVLARVEQIVSEFLEL
ncbi:MAG: type II toxin-antitoxin system PemK/MazF family toxin [Bifidobacteriaceae bacterium]|jgi:mRNA interferase MazF|nr:type II toxin-antitoxin system PemK/MazF family toxin [Bifidobacteriaceae bacterium]